MGHVDFQPDALRTWHWPGRRHLTHFLALALFALALLGLPGCQGGLSQYSGGNRIKVLHKAVVDYNWLLRWQEWEKASRFVRSEDQQAFKMGFYQIEDEFRITQYDIRDTDVDETDAKSADVIVLYRYYLLPSITEKKVNITQRWVWSEDENRWAVEDPLGFLDKILKRSASRSGVRTVRSRVRDGDL